MALVLLLLLPDILTAAAAIATTPIWYCTMSCNVQLLLAVCTLLELLTVLQTGAAATATPVTAAATPNTAARAVCW